jgi:hypothetical protein
MDAITFVDKLDALSPASDSKSVDADLAEAHEVCIKDSASTDTDKDVKWTSIDGPGVRACSLTVQRSEQQLDPEGC